jgi:hypothetical protein
MSTPFDPAQFLDLEITEPSVRRPPLPVGDYVAIVGEIRAETWTGKPGGKAEGKSGMKYVVPLSIDVPPAVQQQLGLTQSTITLTDGIMLDLNEGGTIDTGPGKNGGLRRYRDALDMNKPGEVFRARAMQGRPIRVKIEHEIYQGEAVERIGGVARP